ncbi:MAG TPA: RebB family R body protein [Sphingomonas sp.]|nr:RebB family R body protein [Sphingomonas sp.]
MAFPTAVNSQITDAVTQANVQVVGTAPAMALANLYQATAQALANAAHNATAQQQQLWITAQAATAAGVTLIYASAGTTLVVPEAEPAGPTPAPKPGA